VPSTIEIEISPARGASPRRTRREAVRLDDDVARFLWLEEQIVFVARTDHDAPADRRLASFWRAPRSPLCFVGPLTSRSTFGGELSRAEELAELARRVELFDVSQPPTNFPSTVELRDRRPARVLLDAVRISADESTFTVSYFGTYPSRIFVTVAENPHCGKWRLPFMNKNDAVLFYQAPRFANA